ncbi:MAG: hypothetical protein WC656_01710 [Sulfurimonas sp.]|jgi:hypothetical protein
MKNLTKYNLVLNAIGILLLLLIVIIEYYNQVVLSSGYKHDVMADESVNTMYMLLRMSLWKIHLFAGILVSILFLIKGIVNKNTMFLKLAVFVLITGVANYFFHNTLLFLFHIGYCVLASIMFVMMLYKELKMENSYAK